MRGYIGVYVTTSYFSDRCQREVIEGKFPIILINGQRVAKEVMALMHANGYSSVTKYLDYIDSLHYQKIMQRDPEEILSM
jgi:restriction endonuclease Mrr